MASAIQLENDRISKVAVDRILNTRVKTLVDQWARGDLILCPILGGRGLAGVQLRYNIGEASGDYIFACLNLSSRVIYNYLGESMFRCTVLTNPSVNERAVTFNNSMPVTNYEATNNFLARDIASNVKLTKKVIGLIKGAEKLATSGKLYLNYGKVIH